ncbi:thioredoxin family protein [Oscillatoria amoena NRMC-F 0135]|nr:thioredoxin family protein [Oscillatoria amoena NRMC-F 0135]
MPRTFLRATCKIVELGHIVGTMKKSLFTILSAALVTALGFTAAQAEVKVGQPAPDFTLTDTSGKSHKLSDFKGKYVVLEWLNHGCPFVVAQYKPGLMQASQEKVTGMGGVWLSINSTNETHKDYLSPEKEAEKAKEVGSKATAILHDTDGKVGKEYGAKTTPQMFVINPDGVVIYAGAVDNRKEGAERIDYAIVAITEASEGKPVTTASTKPYGCSVKYK